MTIRTRPADSGFLAFLREETAEAHRQLESLPLSRQIIAPGVSLVDYRRYLEVMYPVVAETEDRIFPLLREALPDLDLRRKLSLIESDLEVLGSDRKEKIPGFFAGDDVLTVYHAMGVMYVMEGSTLGGRVILKNLTASLGLSEDRGLRFFSGYGSQTGPVWESFLRNLIQLPQSTDEEQMVAAAASGAFHRIYLHMESATKVSL